MIGGMNNRLVIKQISTFPLVHIMLKSANIYNVLIDFSLTAKVATSILLSGHGSAISSAKQGKSVFYNLVKNNELVVWATQTWVHFMKILTVYTLNSHLLTLKAHNHKKYVIFVVH